MNASKDLLGDVNRPYDQEARDAIERTLLATYDNKDSVAASLKQALWQTFHLAERNFSPSGNENEKLNEIASSALRLRVERFSRGRRLALR